MKMAQVWLRLAEEQAPPIFPIEQDRPVIRYESGIA
jgi:hypothetical protein